MRCKRKVILDLDTGVDVAVAQVLAGSIREIDLVGVTTTWGEKPLAAATFQALQASSLLEREIPVYAGCASAFAKHAYRKPGLLVGDSKPAEDGDHLPYIGISQQKSIASPAAQHAVQFIIETCRESRQKITLIGLGPLTNLGMAVSVAPDIVKNIKEVVIVGGSIDASNITICAEKNIWLDPEAAQIVIQSGAKVVIVPIDITCQLGLSQKIRMACQTLIGPVGEFFKEALSQSIENQQVLNPKAPAAVSPFNALISLAYLVDPLPLLDLRHVHLQVCLDHNEGAGVLLIDGRQYHQPPNAYVALEADPGAFNAFVQKSLAGLGAGC